MTVILVGFKPVFETELLEKAIKENGSEPFIIDMGDWPGEKLKLTPGEDIVEFGASINLSDIDGAYFHPHSMFRPRDLVYRDAFDKSRDFYPQINQIKEHRSVFESLCRILESRGITVIPRLKNFYLQQRKPWQLECFKHSDIPVPETIITNDPPEVRSFYDNHEEVIFKPVSTGAPPKMLTEEDLDETRMTDLQTSPVQFQEFIPGEDLRVYILDGEVIGGIRYEKDQFSFKLDQSGEERYIRKSATLSEDIKENAIKAADLTDLSFAGVDIRSQPNGDHAVLEINQAPAFGRADKHANQNVATQLATYLTNK